MPKEITLNKIYSDNSYNSFFEQIVQDTETCVICLEDYDNSNTQCVISTNLITSSCNCNYNVHESCLSRWANNNNNNNITCLVCASDANLINPPLEIFHQEEINKCVFLKKISTRSILAALFLTILWLALCVEHVYNYKHVKQHNTTIW